MSELAASPRCGSGLERWFRFQQNKTTLARDTIAGMTTFIVMSYIIFVNPAILGFAGVPNLEGQGLPFEAVLTSTCLVAGVMTILMGMYTITDGIAACFIVYVLIRTFQKQEFSWI